MKDGVTLEHHLALWAARDDARRAEVATTLLAIAGACTRIAAIVSAGALGGAGALGFCAQLDAARGARARGGAPRNGAPVDGSGEADSLGAAARRDGAPPAHGTALDGASLSATILDHGAGDAQKVLDVMANAILFSALRDAPVAALVSEEMDSAVPLNPSGSLLVAIDPLDGSSNIDANVSIGTIFSILPAPADGSPPEHASAFFQPGEHQVAAGYVIYGPQTALALTLGAGTHLFTLDRHSSQFRLTAEHIRVPPKTREFAINASNHRHWDEPIRIYVDDCLKGCDGPRGEDFNMRWIASMVAEAHRVLARGGIYLYPGDLRNGYEHGRLRLLYEASPIAWLMEQAGARASTGMARILEITPQALHQRVPLIFGSRDEVDRLDRYHRDPYPLGERSPLFGRRGLFRS